jgi:putative zinc finger/helix-turn-helix YgiT family protein
MKRIATYKKCPNCGQDKLVSVTHTENFDFDLGEEKVRVRVDNVPIEQCKHCGEILSGPVAAKLRHDAICRAAGLLSPTEIKSLRERFGWSQHHLADLTYFGIATVSRWERGRLLQNRSANKVLLALRDCPPFRKYLETLVASQSAKDTNSDGKSAQVMRTSASKLARKAKPRART